MSTLKKIDEKHGFLALQQKEGNAYSILYRLRYGLFGLFSKKLKILPDESTWISLRYCNVCKPELRDVKGEYEFILPRECFTSNFRDTAFGWKYPEDNSMFGNIIEMPNFGDYFGYYTRDDDAVCVVMHVEKKGIISTPLDEISFVLSAERRKPFVNGFGLVYLPPELWGRFVPRF